MVKTISDYVTNIEPLTKDYRTLEEKILEHENNRIKEKEEEKKLEEEELKYYLNKYIQINDDGTGYIIRGQLKTNIENRYHPLNKNIDKLSRNLNNYMNKTFRKSAGGWIGVSYRFDYDDDDTNM